MKNKLARIAKTIFKKKKEAPECKLSDFKIYDKVLVINRV